MKIFGKINSYNGVYGKIIGEDGIKYILLDTNIVDDYINDIDINKEVEFEPEFVKADEYGTHIARFVKVIEKRP